MYHTKISVFITYIKVWLSYFTSNRLFRHLCLNSIWTGKFIIRVANVLAIAKSNMTNKINIILINQVQSVSKFHIMSTEHVWIKSNSMIIYITLVRCIPGCLDSHQNMNQNYHNHPRMTERKKERERDRETESIWRRVLDCVNGVWNQDLRLS